MAEEEATEEIHKLEEEREQKWKEYRKRHKDSPPSTAHPTAVELSVNVFPPATNGEN